MDINKIVQLRLLKNEYKRLSHHGEYSLIHLTYRSYLPHLSDLLKISKLMKLDFEWDGMPDEDDIHLRFKNNSQCFLYRYQQKIVGWTWFHEDVSIDWKTIYQKLNNGDVYVGGAYVSKTCNLPPIAGYMFYNISFSKWLNDLNYNTIYLYSDDWNRASAQLCYKSGFTKYNFLNETD